jgi:hypothetical protein
LNTFENNNQIIQDDAPAHQSENSSVELVKNNILHDIKLQSCFFMQYPFLLRVLTVTERGKRAAATASYKHCVSCYLLYYPTAKSNHRGEWKARKKVRYHHQHISFCDLVSRIVEFVNVATHFKVT